MVVDVAGDVRIVEVECRPLGADPRDGHEVVPRRRAGRRPLQRVAVPPRVVADDPLVLADPRPPHIPQERQHRQTQDVGADRRDGVQRCEALLRPVVGVTPRHALHAEPVLDEEGHVEADEQRPEVDLAERLVEHRPGHLRPPEVEPGEHREHHRAEQHVVEVRDDEVSVGDVEVDRRRRQHDAGQATEEERDEEADREQHRGVEDELSSPHGADPVEELHARRDGDQIGQQGEERQQYGAGREHVVCPHRDGQRRDRDGREDQALVAEDGLTAVDRYDLRDDAEERQRHDVDLGMAEEPEQVLPQDRATGLRVEHVGTEPAVGQQAEQRRGQDREHHQDQDAGDQDIPGEDRHPEHRHTRGRAGRPRS